MSNEITNPASCQTAVSGSAFSIHDLKCGNILNYDTAEGEILLSVVDWQLLQWLTEDPKGFNLVHSPIPLTEDWLLKFGFSDKDYKKGYIGKDFKKSSGMILNFVLSKPFSKGEWNNTYTYDFEGLRFCKMEFVHELQNFYHCLTGVMLSLSCPLKKCNSCVWWYNGEECNNINLCSGNNQWSEKP